MECIRAKGNIIGDIITLRQKQQGNGPPIHLPISIKLDSSTTKSLISGNKGEQGGKRQGQLLDKTWEVVTTVPSPRMRAAQRRRKTTMNATLEVVTSLCPPPMMITRVT
jgi:hypothetical protein